jgi:hypothetical protein
MSAALPPPDAREWLSEVLREAAAHLSRAGLRDENARAAFALGFIMGAAGIDARGELDRAIRGDLPDPDPPR